MLSYTDVKNSKPDALTALAKAWTGVADTHTDAATTLNAQATEKLWGGSLAGHSIRAAHGRSEQFQAQIKAGATEADDLAAKITGFAATVTRLQGELATLVSEAGHAGMDVSATGVVSVPNATMKLLSDSGHMDLQATALNSAEKFNARIEEVLKKATKADGDFKQKLRLVAELDSAGDASFNADSAADITDARSKTDAAAAVRLFNKAEGGGLSHEEQLRLTRLLKAHRGDELFAETMMKSIDARDFLQYSGNIAAADTGDHDDVTALQRELGHALATATNADPVFAESWNQALRDQGERVFEYQTATGETRHATGYQALAPILENGDYSKEFLVPITKDMTEDWAASKSQWHLYGDDAKNPFDYTGSRSLNPLNAAMTAMGHSPEASLEFFRDKPQPPFSHDKNADYFDYLMSRSREGDAYNVALDGGTLSHALESASTGMPYDDTSGDRPPHTGEMEAFTNRVVDHVAANRGDFSLGGVHSNMTASLGDIAANYIEDIHASVNDGDKSEVVPESLSEDGGYAFGDSSGSLNRFMAAISHDPDAYATILGASAGTMSESVEHKWLQNQDDFEDADIKGAAMGHTRLMGTMDEGWNQSVKKDYFEDAEHKNAFIDKVKTGLSIGGNVHPATAIGGTGVNDLILSDIQKTNIEAAGEKAHIDVTDKSAMQMGVLNNTVMNTYYETLVANDVNPAIAKEKAVQALEGIDGYYVRGQQLVKEPN